MLSPVAGQGFDGLKSVGVLDAWNAPSLAAFATRQLRGREATEVERRREEQHEHGQDERELHQALAARPLGEMPAGAVEEASRRDVGEDHG